MLLPALDRRLVKYPQLGSCERPLLGSSLTSADRHVRSIPPATTHSDFLHDRSLIAKALARAPQGKADPLEVGYVDGDHVPVIVRATNASDKRLR